jgi:hypothetical protein
LDALNELNYDVAKCDKIGKNTIRGLEFAKRFLREKALSALR